jgi:hypothetical protein
VVVVVVVVVMVVMVVVAAAVVALSAHIRPQARTQTRTHATTRTRTFSITIALRSIRCVVQPPTMTAYFSTKPNLRPARKRARQVSLFSSTVLRTVRASGWSACSARGRTKRVREKAVQSASGAVNAGDGRALLSLSSSLPLSVSACICLFVCLSVCVSVCLSVCLSDTDRQTVHLSVCLSVCLSLAFFSLPLSRHTLYLSLSVAHTISLALSHTFFLSR